MPNACHQLFVASRTAVMFVMLVLLGCGAPQASSQTAKPATSDMPFFASPSIAQLEQQLNASCQKGDLFVLATLYDKTGRPEMAFDTYIRAIDAASQSPSLYWEGIGAAIGMVNIRRRVNAFESRLQPHLNRWSASPGDLAPEAVYQLRTLAFSFALKKGKTQKSNQLLKQTGCITDWQLAGPIATDKRGTSTLKQLLQSRTWPKEIDAGAGRPSMPTERKELDICQLSAPPVSSANTGTIVGRAAIYVKESGNIKLRLHTTSDAQIFIDGHQVHAQQSQTHWLPETRWITTWLPAGAHQITATVFSPAFAPSFSLSALSPNQHQLLNDSVNLPVTTQYAPHKGKAHHAPQSTATSSVLAQMLYALWNVNPYEWQKHARHLDEKLPLHRLLLAAYQLMTPFNAPEVGMETARHIYDGVIREMPNAYEAAVYLARHAHQSGRTEESIDILENAMTAMPDEPMLPLTLAEIAFDKEWIPAAQKYLTKTIDLSGDTCETQQWAYAIAVHEKKYQTALQLASEIHLCAASSIDLATELTRQGKFEDASNALWQLAKHEPNSMSTQIDAALGFVRAGKTAKGIQLLKATQKKFPLAVDPVLHLIDAFLATGKNDKAKALCDQQTLLPAHPQLLLTCEMVAKTNTLNMYRVDGLETVNQFIQKKEKPSTDFSWVLDRMVYVLDRFGSGIQLVHWIGHINSQDAVSEYGELHVPYGARVLQARVIKPSLETFYPTQVENKPGLSLPNLAIGDYVELETLSTVPAHTVFPGGFDTEPFYFRDFNSAFERSELIVLAPESLNLQYETRGTPVPAMHHSLDSMQVVTFRTRDQQPLRTEPDTPDAREFLPSVRIAANATLDAICQNINEQLYTMSQQCPEIDQMLNRSIVSIKNQDAQIKAIHNWISLNIEDDMILFEPAAHVFSRKRGSRARLFVQMLSQLNIDAELGLAMTAFDDHAPSTVPDINRYSVPVVRLPNGSWISFQDRHAPFGALPSELRHQPVLLPGKCRIEKTDAGNTPFERSDIVAELTVDPTGNATGTVTESITGDTAAILRSMLESPESEHRKLIEEHLLSALFPDASLTGFSVENSRNAQLPLKIKYTVSVSQFIRQTTNKQDKKTSQLFVPMPVNFEHYTGGVASRELPLVLATYFKANRAIRLHLPSGMHVQQLPDSHCSAPTVTNARYCMSFNASDNSIDIQIEATVDIERISAKHYTGFQDFVLTTEQMNSASIDIEY